MTDFERIEKAIFYIRENFKDQPALDTVAEQVHLSPFHFQRLFTEWAGISPKKFLQFISIEHAKKMLQKSHSLATASFETGLSGTGRLHDLFISIEGMTPGEYKNAGESLTIFYHTASTPFGEIVIGSTGKGICHISFTETCDDPSAVIREKFPYAVIEERNAGDINILKLFNNDRTDLKEIKLHLKGTPFQLKVWEALLQIPFAGVSTYNSIASEIRSPGASRAVGTAVAQNPVAFLIPCHRVIRSTGVIGEYHWGSTRKAAMIGWEAAKSVYS